MYLVDPIEKRIETAVDAVNQLNLQLESLTNEYDDTMKRLQEWKSRVGELALLRDIRDGKLTVLRSDTKEEATIHIL